MSSEQITWTPIDLPSGSLPSVDVKFEVPAHAVTPSEKQLSRLDRIRVELPRLWIDAMSGLQDRFNEIGEGQQAQSDVLSAGMFIPEPEDEETDDNFYWCIGLNIRNREPWQGWEVVFEGFEFKHINFYP